MDRDIKRLLSLRANPHFQLSPSELKQIEEWEKAQKTIEIKNSNEITTMYQSLGEVIVKKGDTVTQGQVIAKSGACVLNSDIKQGLHFEMYKNGTVINPEKSYDKNLKDIINN